MKNGRIDALKDKHAQLEHEIIFLNSSLSADRSQILELKRKKLQVKDQLVAAAWSASRHAPYQEAMRA